MRAMTEWRRRQRKGDAGPQGKLMLFFGARTKEELPYFGPLMSLPKDFMDINLVFSREAGKTKRYVQDALRERATDVGALLADANTHIYVCGLKAMEEGVVLALQEVAQRQGLNWEPLSAAMKSQGRIHFETY
jgi:benzoyl-CoA 2,3-dioxygenase component A